MFSNTTPLNWHGTLKRLKKDYTPGTLGQELGIGVQNNILDEARGWPTKKKPSVVYTDAVNTQVQAVDKKHTLQRFSKKLLSEVGASSSAKAEAAAPAGSPSSPGLTSPGSVAAPAARRVTLDPTAGTPAEGGGAAEAASSKSATAQIFSSEPKSVSPKKLRGGGRALAAAGKVVLAPQCAVALSALRPGGGGLSGGVVTLAVSHLSLGSVGCSYATRA
jgi:hypothetical protein